MRQAEVPCGMAVRRIFSGSKRSIEWTGTLTCPYIFLCQLPVIPNWTALF